MTMKAQIRTDALGNITVHMEGGLDYNSTEPLRIELQELISRNPTCLVTLDMHGLEFVGSSGIGHFVETIKLLNNNKNRVSLKNVKTEFARVFKLYNFDVLSAMVNELENDQTEDLNQRFGNRKNTFQN